ncbi:MAG: hypothetical protein FGM24_01855 [Candidatus Kapabacteria bacterium]|nr:hypothetical protein [Candidatus Kapabacteria bacterium]
MTGLPLRYIALCAAAVLVVDAGYGTAQTLPKIMLAQCSVDTSDKAISVGKAEAALALAVGLSGKASFIATAARDSILLAASNRPEDRTVLGAASVVGARIVAFLNVRRLHHLVRSEVILIDAALPSEQRRGVGYATLRLHHADESVLADPAMLEATQRAFAVAMQDSLMYLQDSVDSAFYVRPTHLTAVGGITFTNDPALQPWEIFKQKVAVSYDIAQMIAHGLADADRYTVVDIETRDTMYAMLGLHLTENYNQVSAIELQQLSRFDVTHLVTGTVQRTEKGAVLTLSLNAIKPDERYSQIRSIERLVSADTKLAVREAVQDALTELLAEADR